MLHSSLILLIIGIAVLSVPFLTVDTFAETINWTGAAGDDDVDEDGISDNTDFFKPANWDLNRIPISTDEILIETDDDCINPGFFVILTSDFTIDDVMVLGCGGALGFFSDVDLTFTNNGLFIGGMTQQGHVVNNGDFVIRGFSTASETGTVNSYPATGFLANDNGRIFDNYDNFTVNGILVNYGYINNYGIILNNNTIFHGVGSSTSGLINHNPGIINNTSFSTLSVGPGSVSNGIFEPNVLQNNGTINNDGDIVIICNNTIINSGTISGFPQVDLCDDADSDRILDNIDTLPNTPSFNFSDISLGGTTFGTIVDEGSGHELLAVDMPDPDGIRISIISEDPNFDTPATFSLCEGSSQITIDAPSKTIVTCGSSIIEAQLGQVDATFTGTDGSVFTAIINPPNRIIFDPDTLVFIADDSNASTITIHSDSGDFTVAPGQTVSLGFFCGKPQSDYNVITGTESDDVLMGTNGDDLIFGLGGADKIKGKKGNDCIFGGNGNDKIWGGKGVDTIDGEDGDDKIQANQDNDVIIGGLGNDWISAGQGDDTASGGDGNDKIFGRQGNDELNGDTGDDKIHGGQGDDTIMGGADMDKCHGGQGNNSIDCETVKPMLEEDDEPEE